jgi:hypothetical protein
MKSHGELMGFGTLRCESVGKTAGLVVIKIRTISIAATHPPVSDVRPRDFSTVDVLGPGP